MENLCGDVDFEFHKRARSDGDTGAWRGRRGDDGGAGEASGVGGGEKPEVVIGEMRRWGRECWILCPNIHCTAGNLQHAWFLCLHNCRPQIHLSAVHI